MKAILDKLDRFGISGLEHSGVHLVDHLVGTYEITRDWGCPDPVCLAALCHSIYGTESFSKTPASLEDRVDLRKIIGEEAERLAYLFGAHVKDSLWVNLEKNSDYGIWDRFENIPLNLSREDLSNLITLTLANWLEQRPREAEEFQNLRKEEFLRSEKFLSKGAFLDFLKAYGLENDTSS